MNFCDGNFTGLHLSFSYGLKVRAPFFPHVCVLTHIIDVLSAAEVSVTVSPSASFIPQSPQHLLSIQIKGWRDGDRSGVAVERGTFLWVLNPESKL